MKMINEVRKGKRKVQGVQQSQTAAIPRYQEEEETDKTNSNLHWVLNTKWSTGPFPYNLSMSAFVSLSQPLTSGFQFCF